MDKPTHTHGNILDLLLTNLDDNISDLQIHPDQFCHQITTYTITFSVSVGVATSSKSTTSLLTIIPKGNYQGLSKYLLQSDFMPCYFLL